MRTDIRDKLVDVARKQDIIPYGELAPMAGLDMNNPADRNKIGHLLGTISASEHEQGRPLLSAVVVHAGSGLPGHGFFQLGKDLGLVADQDELAFAVTQLKKVHSYWQGR